MVEDTVRSLAISLGSVFAVTLVLGGFDFKTAIITIFIIILIVINLVTTTTTTLKDIQYEILKKLFSLLKDWFLKSILKSFRMIQIYCNLITLKKLKRE